MDVKVVFKRNTNSGKQSAKPLSNQTKRTNSNFAVGSERNNGWLTEEWMQHVAECCEVPLTHVEGVVTFYTMFRLKPPGKYHLQVCTCVPCCLVGGTEILEYTEKKLNTHAGYTSADGLFSIEEMECIGACSYAPAMIVNEDYHEQVTPEKWIN